MKIETNIDVLRYQVICVVMHIQSLKEVISDALQDEFLRLFESYMFLCHESYIFLSRKILKNNKIKSGKVKEQNDEKVHF